MGTLTALHAELLTLLTGAGIDAGFGPRRDAPAVNVTIWPTPGIERYLRSCGGPTDRADLAQFDCTGRTVLEALGQVDKVRAALAGKRLTAAGTGGGLLVEDSFAERGLTDVSADPTRVSYPLSFVIITKGIR